MTPILMNSGKIKFDENGQNINSAITMLQAEKGFPRVIAPREIANATLQYPMVPFGGPVMALLWTNVIISGVLTGLVYGLIALGLTIIFGVIRVVNFAHGAMVVFGIYIGYYTGVLVGAADHCRRVGRRLRDVRGGLLLRKPSRQEVRQSAALRPVHPVHTVSLCCLPDCN